MHQFNLLFICGSLSLLLLAACATNQSPVNNAATPAPKNYNQIFEALVDTVRTHFYDTTFIQGRFPALTAQYREKIKTIKEQAPFDAAMRAYLAEFHTSHTSYHSPADHSYYHLAGIFEPLPNVRAVFGEEGVQYPSIGLLTERKAEQIVISGVLDGSPAREAGLKKGDVLQWVNGELYSITQLREHLGGSITYPALRNGETLQIKVSPVMARPQEELLTACRESARVIERSGKKIAYIHMWSFAGTPFYELLKEELLYGKLADADALVLDIRDGWGGASPEYLNLFNRDIPNLVFHDREGQSREFSTQWRKPVGLLINEGSRSGKELLAFGFKKYKIGPVIGSKTAGAVTAGRIFFLPDNSLLYLAVSEVAVDGEVLEGIGVFPDVQISDDLTTDIDEQLEEAIRVLLSQW